MSKKILILSSSPRKNGNSDYLCEQFLKGAVESGHEVEKIFVSEKNIKFCRACNVCQKTHKCVIKDDMEEILEKMVAADVLVLSSPVYFYSVSGQIKTLIDRSFARFTEMIDKELYYILTSGSPKKEAVARSIECFRGYAENLKGSKEKGIIFGNGLFEKNDAKNSEAAKIAYEFGKNV